MADAAERTSVACKMPNGLHLDLHETQRDDKGNVLWTQRRRIGTLRGTGVRRSAVPHTIGGAAFTMINAADFAEWMKQHKDNPVVKEGFVFAELKAADAHARAKDEETRRGQFQPIEPKAEGIAPLVKDDKAA